ncbi:hypothetical protein KL86CLO1_12314 [uncultured Eubacteriales bacterium]|uniref:Uncharacterized protein n=1 Tax=uncultured Eubacteriales bacterium TaxID=172733 RepID=A0A212K743_9FIRM|nr:hypothetical protein KL86CLO1_12314 [uncultured Eubacteriales bacterium]
MIVEQTFDIKANKYYNKNRR